MLSGQSTIFHNAQQGDIARGIGGNDTRLRFKEFIKRLIQNLSKIKLKNKFSFSAEIDVSSTELKFRISVSWKLTEEFLTMIKFSKNDLSIQNRLNKSENRELKCRCHVEIKI